MEQTLLKVLLNIRITWSPQKISYLFSPAHSGFVIETTENRVIVLNKTLKESV